MSIKDFWYNHLHKIKVCIPENQIVIFADGSSDSLEASRIDTTSCKDGTYVLNCDKYLHVYLTDITTFNRVKFYRESRCKKIATVVIVKGKVKNIEWHEGV